MFTNINFTYTIQLDSFLFFVFIVNVSVTVRQGALTVKGLRERVFAVVVLMLTDTGVMRCQFVKKWEKQPRAL